MEKTRISGLSFKIALKEDAPIIMNYINKLALYEKLEHEVTGSIELLEENLFNKNYAQALLLYHNSKIIGMALYFYTFSTFHTKPSLYLEDLYIDIEYRNKGYGQEVFFQLVKIAHQNKCTRLEWVCLDWNISSLSFYEKSIKAKALNEWIKLRLDEEQINNVIKNNHF